jgi:hypothetical protein
LANVVETLDESQWGAEEVERIQAATLIRGMGDLGRIRDMRDLALQDWRDALAAADLANEDWPERLDAELGQG